MRKRTRAACILMLVLAVPAMGARAQQPDSARRNPAAVAEAFFDAIAAAQWKEAAGYLDLDAFEQYLRAQIEQARESRMSPPVTAERLMRSDTSMPRAVAEYEARRLDESRANDSRLSYQFADITSVDSLAALTVLDAAARWLEARDIRYAMRRSIEAAKARGQCVPNVPADSLIPPQPPRIVLGTIVRDTEAYVLNSGAQPDLSRLPPAISWLAPPPNVLQLRRRGAAWRIIGGRDMLGNGNQIIGIASCESAPKR
ncbi:MAG TPA: hypothetical protein VFJ96_10445 [Gemmatimonadaceae bacterium]|nr:hypothetical protein [Gemmatimonadaceae bacterium]